MARKDREIAELVTPGRLDKPVIVLRRVNVGPLSVKPNRRAPSVMDRIGSGYIEQGVEEKETTWFADGLIINDQPRMSGVTDEIMRNTLGFALANTQTGEILREGGPDSLAELQTMADSAKVSINVGLTGLDEEPNNDPEGAEDEAAIAAAQAEADEAAAAAAAAADASAGNS